MRHKASLVPPNLNDFDMGINRSGCKAMQQQAMAKFDELVGS